VEPRVIVVTSGKGGVGKTTTTANVSFALAKAGFKVVAIDADIGLRNLDVVMGLENRVVYNFIDVIEGACRLPQALIRDKRVDNLFLLPAAQTRTKDAVNPEQMVDLCEMLKKEDFDFILIDSPAGIEGGFKNAAIGATEALVVTTPEIPSVRDADRIIGLLESMEKAPIRLVINRVKPKMVKEGEMLDVQDVLDVLAIELIGIVPDDESVVKSANRGEPLTSGDTSLASQAFTNIADRLLGKEVPFLNLNSHEGSGFFSGIRRLFGL
jgi:septum site-determining protein MinD